MMDAIARRRRLLFFGLTFRMNSAGGGSRHIRRSPSFFSSRRGLGAACDAAADLDEVDAARAQEYALLATLLSRAPDQALLSRIAELPGDTSRRPIQWNINSSLFQIAGHILPEICQLQRRACRVG